MRVAGEAKMMAFTKSLAARGTPGFAAEFKRELAQVPVDALPLRGALAHSNQSVDGSIEPVVLAVSEETGSLRVKTGIFFAGIDAGSCCADDPGGPCEQTEYCEILVIIDKTSSLGDIILLDE